LGERRAIYTFKQVRTGFFGLKVLFNTSFQHCAHGQQAVFFSLALADMHHAPVNIHVGYFE
jgi:hypothetical protein